MRRLNVGISVAFVVMLLATAGCTTSESTMQDKEITESRAYSSYWTLEDFLRRASGVQLQGSGDNIQVIIRGHKSINSPLAQPLFVVDGQKAGRNYGRVSNMFARGEILSVKVLPAGATALYGMEGNFGVIEIKSKYSATKDF